MTGVKIGIIMGSQSDWSTMREAASILDELGVEYETRIVSAHRTPDRLWDYGKTAVERGLQVIFAAAGERIVLRHIATDRAVFARGALKAALWGQGRKPGQYDMIDVLGLNDN